MSVVVEAGQAPGQGISQIIQGRRQVGLVRHRVVVCAAQLAVDARLEGRTIRRYAVGIILTGDLAVAGVMHVVSALVCAGRVVGHEQGVGEDREEEEGGEETHRRRLGGQPCSREDQSGRSRNRRGLSLINQTEEMAEQSWSTRGFGGYTPDQRHERHVCIWHEGLAASRWTGSLAI
jgi:hypothetical protein